MQMHRELADYHPGSRRCSPARLLSGNECMSFMVN